MNGYPSFPTPDSSPIAGTLATVESKVHTRPEPPPIVAPPVVHSGPCPVPELPPPVVVSVDRWSPLRLGLRDFMIGGVCLLLGVIAANSDSLLRNNQSLSVAIGGAATTQTRDTLLNADVVELSDVQRVIAATPVEPFSAALNSVANDERLHIQPQPIVPNIENEIAVGADEQSGMDEVASSSDSFKIDEVKPADIVIAASKESPAIDTHVSHVAVDQPTAVFADAAAALAAIVNAGPSMPSLPDLESQSTIIPTAPCESGTCQEAPRSLNTVLNWAKTPADAYRQADESEKLVFLIHVSGNFEIPGFT